MQRPYLSQRLYAGLQLKRQMTLVSAPPGFGKTTCVVEWADSLDRPLTWLSLDPGDDDPNRFFTYFVAALQKVDAALGREIETVLQAGQLPPAEVIATALSNDILQLENQFLFVLDDFHVIQDPAILLVIEKLITNPPAPLHLVLITREDPPLPLARLRAHNRLTEIRAQDLRFTSHDTQLFFDKLGLSLAQSDMSVLEDKTEGWIAGRQLQPLPCSHH